MNLLVCLFILFDNLFLFGNFSPVHFPLKKYALNRYKRPTCTFSFKFYDPLNLFRDELNYELARRAVVDGVENWRRGSGGRLKFVDLSAVYSTSDHNCQEKFDGLAGVVAHSSYSPHGLIHLDAAENWNDDGVEGGVELSYVITHEIGHILGLRHSTHPDSIMTQKYRSYLPSQTKLSEDDVQAVRAAYAYCNQS